MRTRIERLEEGQYCSLQMKVLATIFNIKENTYIIQQQKSYFIQARITSDKVKYIMLEINAKLILLLDFKGMSN